ncbi:hypothetical protein VZ95_06150, partial [Elstera litoralis]
PAMLILSFVNYGGSFLFPHRPLGLPSLRDLLPGLTFLEPEFWALLIGKPRPILELSFWTLYVEVKFYIIFGALYFWFGLNRAIFGLIFLFFSFCLAAGISILFGDYSWRNDIYFKIIMDMRHYSWFVVGILAFRYKETQDTRWLYGAVGMMLLSVLVLFGRNFDLKLPGLLMGTFFIAAIWFAWLQRLLASRALVFVGGISYPLYLIHENTSVALAVEVGALFSTVAECPHTPWADRCGDGDRLDNRPLAGALASRPPAWRKDCSPPQDLLGCGPTLCRDRRIKFQADLGLGSDD